MSDIAAYRSALEAVADDLERFDPAAPSLHFARGLLAVATPGKPQRALSGAEVRRAYEAGATLEALAAQFDCSVVTVRARLRAEGVAMRPKGRRVSPENLEKRKAVAEYYRSGLSIQQCTAKTGVRASTVRLWLRAEGVAMRERVEAQQAAKKRESKDRVDRIMALRAEGATGAEIGRVLGVTRERVRQIVAKAGLWEAYAVRPLTPAEREAVRAYQSGESLLRMQARLGVGALTARRLLSRAGVGVRRERRYDPEVAAIHRQMAAAYAAGDKVADIVARFGRHPTDIYRALARTGTPRRRKGLQPVVAHASE